ncbi:MAG: lipoate--protein ligase family protein [Candidatus Eisenbacteria bacterium]|nr:lipoate--protein ligase family protein [Candidatus Eisenbacteria bacterium]
MFDAVYLPMLRADGFRHMAVDEYLLECCRSGGVSAALRFYEWKPPAVSLGHSQPFELLDLSACREQGIDVVRRITGGGALLHSQELTYCFVIGRDPARVAVRPREAASAVARSLILGLSGLGVRAARTLLSRPPDRTGGETPAVGGSAGAPGGESAAVCFMSGVENEVEVSGRKLAGCAHKCTREAFFSHGSVMTGPGHLRLARLLKPNSESSRAVLGQGMAERSVSLSELLPEAPAVDEMESVFRSAFESVFGLSLRPEGLSPAAGELVEEWAAEKRAALAAAFRAVEPSGGVR